MFDETSDTSGQVHDLWLPEKKVGWSLLLWSTSSSWDSAHSKTTCPFVLVFGYPQAVLRLLKSPHTNELDGIVGRSGISTSAGGAWLVQVAEVVSHGFKCNPLYSRIL